MRICVVVWLFTLCCFNLKVDAQPYYFTHYQVEDGLSNNAVLCIMQDHLGFMWFGTRDGLNRFDGLSYKTFRYNSTDANSIGSNSIISLSEDVERKTIWVGTEKGLYVFDQKTESFSQFLYAANGAVQSVKVIGDYVYFNTLYVLFRHNINDNVTQSFTLKEELTAYTVLKDGSLWVATASGKMASYNPETKNFDFYHDLFKHSSHAVSKWINTVAEATEGLLLVGTSNQGLKLFDTRTFEYKDLLAVNPDQSDIIVRDMMRVSEQDYWIATQSGIYIYNLQHGIITHLQKEFDPYSLSDNTVQTLCMDNHGGIWVGTYFGGVNYFPKLPLTFKKYYPKANGNSVRGNAIGEIQEDALGRLWIGTEDAGLNRFDIQTELFTNFDPAFNKKTISYSNVHALLVDGDRIWAGTFLHGLDLLDINGRRLHNFNTLNTGIGSNFISVLLKTKTGIVIAATDKGAYQYIPERRDFVWIDGLPKAFFRAMQQDSKGLIWAGTYGKGFYVYDPVTNKSQRYLFSINGNQNLSCNTINDIYCDSTGLVWFATEGGLCRYNLAKNELKIFSSKDGLPTDVVYTILEDANKNLWISTSKGLSRFTPATKTFRTFNKSHGLLTDQFNYRSAFKDSRGIMYFGSVKGLISFNSDSIARYPISAPTYLTGFQVFNKELSIDSAGTPLQQSISFTDRIMLAHNQSTFSIDFASLDYSAPTHIAYAYKMDGLDKNWTYLTSNRRVYFTELAPGNYTFVVKRMAEDDKEGTSTQLEIEIKPPFWLSLPAFTIYTLLAFLTVFFTARFFVQRARARNQQRLDKLAFEKERENYEDKINFFTNLAHEIKTPLTLINGPMENIMDKIQEFPSLKNNIELMSRNTERLMHLTNQLLDFRRFEMNGFHLTYSYLNVSTLFNGVYLRFKPFADQMMLSVNVDAEEGLMAYADEEALSKIFSNLIDNAIKYANKQVLLQLQYADAGEVEYVLTCSNDGFIIPPENKEMIFDSFFRLKETSHNPGSGIGLTLSRSLAEIHGGRLVLDTSAGDRNVFVLSLPVHPLNDNHNSR